MRRKRTMLSTNQEKLKREERALIAQKTYLERLLTLEKNRIHHETVRMVVSLSALRKEKARLQEIEQQLLNQMRNSDQS